jgi:hypothetical protein
MLRCAVSIVFSIDPWPQAPSTTPIWQYGHAGASAIDEVPYLARGDLAVLLGDLVHQVGHRGHGLAPSVRHVRGLRLGLDGSALNLQSQA